MCLAVPAKLIEVLDGSRARASIGGIVKEIAVDLIDQPKAGEYVILHVGYALSRMDEAEALRTLSLMEAEGQLDGVRNEIR